MAGTDTSWLDGHVASSAGVGQLFQVVLGIEGGRAPGAGGSDRLPVGVVDQVSAGEYASQVGPGAAPLTDDIARFVEVDDTLDELVTRVMPDGDEEAGHSQLRLGAGHRVGDRHAGQLGVPVQRGHGSST